MRTACRAVAGEFVSRRLIALSLLLCMVAVPLGTLAGAHASSPTALVVVAVLTGLTAFSNAAMWARDGRLNQLRMWPVSDRTLARATLTVGTMLFLVEFGIPQVVLYYSAGVVEVGAVVFSVLTYAACWSVLLYPRGYVWGLLFVVMGVAAGLAYVLPLWVVCGLLVACVLVNGYCAQSVPALGTRAPRPVAQLRNYFAVAGLADQRVWVNAVGVAAFAAIFISLAPPDTISQPLGLCLPFSASVLTTMLSRDPATHDAVRMLGRERYFYTQYWIFLSLYFIVMCGVVAAVSGELTWALIPICCIVAGIFTLLEARWPLRKKQTEKEILKHPRRYVVTALGGIMLIAAV